MKISTDLTTRQQVLIWLYNQDNEKGHTLKQIHEGLGKAGISLTHTQALAGLQGLRNGLVSPLIQSTREKRTLFHKLPRIVKDIPVADLLKVSAKRSRYRVQDLANDYPSIRPLLVKNHVRLSSSKPKQPATVQERKSEPNQVDLLTSLKLVEAVRELVSVLTGPDGGIKVQVQVSLVAPKD